MIAWRARLALCVWLSAAAASAQEWVPIEVRDGLLTFPAVVEGVTVTAMLDTGAGTNSIDAAFVEKIALPLSGPSYRMTGAFSTRELVPSASRLDVDIFGVRVAPRDTPVTVHPDAPLLIGVAFLSGFILQLDYPASRMRVLSRKSIDLDDYDNVPMRRAERTTDAAIQVVFPGDKKLWLLLDTGATGPILLYRGVAEREGWLGAYGRGHSAASDILGKVAELEMLVIPALRVGPFELGDVPVAVPSEGERLFAGRERWARVQTGTHITRGARASGLLGYDVLRHFVVTIDYDRELIHLAPQPQPRAGAKGEAQPR